MAAARREITVIVGEDAITARPDELDRHTSSPWSSYAPSARDRPNFIVYASSTAQVSEVMKVCHGRRVPVVAFSGGTSLEGQFANVCGGISLDLSRMNKILEVHRDDLDAVVQPGVTYSDLNVALEPDGLFFPPDPGPGAMIGGMVGTGCSGTNAFYYGTMRDWVVNLTVVLADGTIVKTRRRPRKSSAGYDLTKLFIGSEGTLGIVTEAVVKLTAKPVHERVAVVAFDTCQDACDTVIKIVRLGIKVGAVELLGGKLMRLMNETANSSKVWRESPTLFLKFIGTEKGVAEQMATVEKIALAKGARSMDLAKDAEDAENLWNARKQLLIALIGSKKPEEIIGLTDVAVPISRLAEVVNATSKEMEVVGFPDSIVGHVGDGNFHTSLFYTEAQKPVVKKLVHDMIARAVEMEGTVSGEHGVGMTKRDYLEQELGKTTVDLMRQVKHALDPLCLLNCDKVIRMKSPLTKPDI